MALALPRAACSPTRRLGNPVDRRLMVRSQREGMSAHSCFAAAPVDRRGNREIHCRNYTWRMRHSDDRHVRRAVVVAGWRCCGARSNHGCSVAARGAAEIGGATGGANCQHASRETPATGFDGRRGTLRDSLVGRAPGGDPVGGGDELFRYHIPDRGSGCARTRTKNRTAGEILSGCRNAGPQHEHAALAG